MRTTVAIADELLAAAKRVARSRGVPLGEVIDAALRRELSSPPATEQRPAIPVFSHGTGPRPGIDLASNRSVHEALDHDVELTKLR